jgi:hypothetical protein
MDGAEPDGTREDFPNVYDGARGVHFVEKTMESGRSTEKWTRTLRGDPREGSAKQPKSPSGKVRATSGLRGLLSSPHVWVKQHRAFGNPDTRATVGRTGQDRHVCAAPARVRLRRLASFEEGKAWTVEWKHAVRSRRESRRHSYGLGLGDRAGVG